MTALQPHARQRLIFVMVFYPSLLFSPFGTYLFILPSHTTLTKATRCSILVVKLSAGSRLTLEQSVSGHMVQTKILGKLRTRGTNQEQANICGEKVDGKGFVFFTEVFVRIQVYPSKGKRTIKKGA